MAATCPRCVAGPHHVELIAKFARGTLIFGGPGKASVGALATATVTCPNTGEGFEVTVEVPLAAGERVDSVMVAAPEEVTPVGNAGVAAAPNGSPVDWRADELADWRKGSASQGRDVAAKLLAAGTAAVGAYFAILRVVAARRSRRLTAGLRSRPGLATCSPPCWPRSRCSPC